MSNKSRAGARDAIERQAVEFVLALAGDPSEDLRRTVADWLSQAPSHAVAFAKAELAWEEAGRLRGLREAPFPEPGTPAQDSDTPPLALPKSR